MTARFAGLNLIRSNIFDARQGRFSRVAIDGKFSTAYFGLPTVERSVNDPCSVAQGRGTPHSCRGRRSFL